MAQLELERQKRRDQKVESGEALVIRDVIVVEDADDVEAIEEELKAAAREKHPGRELIFDFQFVISGVPRSDGGLRPGMSELPSLGLNSEEDPAACEEALYCAPPQPEQFFTVVIRNGSDLDPGHVEHGHYTIENGLLVVTDGDGQRVGSRPLRVGEDPLSAARRLLRERGNNFGSPINYPRLNNIA